MLRTLLAFSGRATHRRAPIAGLALAAFLVVGAGSATATPLYFTGPLGVGTTAAEVTAAMADDAGLVLLDLDNPLPGLGVVGFSGAGGTSVAFPDCADDPSNLNCIALRVEIPPLTLPLSAASSDPSVTPTEGTSIWTVTNSTGLDLAGAFLIFSWTLGADSGDPSLVGLEPESSDDYVLITKLFGPSSVYAAAVELGPLAASGPGAEATAMVHYRVRDDLIPAGGGNLFLPTLLTEAIVVPVPEPNTLSLFAAGLVGLAAIRRSRCK